MLRRPESTADGVSHRCQTFTDQFLLRYTFLETGQCIGGNSIRGSRNLGGQRLQRLQVSGGDLIARLECLAVQLHPFWPKHDPQANKPFHLPLMPTCPVIVDNGAAGLGCVRLVFATAYRLAKSVYLVLADLWRAHRVTS